VGRGRRAIRDLLDFFPAAATVRRPHGSIRVPLHQVRVGDAVLVAPGECIAVDGTVRSGHSFVDQATITGQLQPAEKSAGAIGYAGTINQSGALEIVAERLGRERASARSSTRSSVRNDRARPYRRRRIATSGKSCTSPWDAPRSHLPSPVTLRRLSQSSSSASVSRRENRQRSHACHAGCPPSGATIDEAPPVAVRLPRHHVAGTWSFAAGAAARTTSTRHFAWGRTPCATLPTTTRSNRFRPCVPITMR
jgi:magnesium-transporting ATPase (P-type)